MPVPLLKNLYGDKQRRCSFKKSHRKHYLAKETANTMSNETIVDYEPLKRHLLKRISMNDEELQLFCNAFKPTHVKKRQFIVQPDFIAQRRYYVISGAFRAFVLNESGDEQTIQFAIADWWITDYNSYIFQQPATMFVMALTDSYVLQIEHHVEQQLKASHHKYETFFRILAEHTAAYMARRMISGLTQDAETRYENFLMQYPDIAQNVPQYALASFLGITTAYLSKLRNKRTGKKS